MASSPTLPITWQGTIAQEWVDYNGHLRDAFYLLLFSYGTDGLMDRIGLDEAGRQATGHSMFTLECHLNFLHEVKQGTPVAVHTRVLGIDSKRVHIYHQLFTEGREEAVAASEQMLLNVEMAGPRGAAFSEPVRGALQGLVSDHANLPAAPYVGRRMALKA
jgi:acyl-CoA thioester hydrolase